MSGRLMHKLATSPALMAKVMATGRMPREYRITSPLIELLERIHPADRVRMRGVRLTKGMGYVPGAKFDNAEQLLRWAKPRERAIEGESWPGDSHQIKSFRGVVSIEVLLAACDVRPDGLEQKYKNWSGGR